MYLRLSSSLTVIEISGAWPQIKKDIENLIQFLEAKFDEAKGDLARFQQEALCVGSGIWNNDRFISRESFLNEVKPWAIENLGENYQESLSLLFVRYLALMGLHTDMDLKKEKKWLDILDALLLF